MAQTTTSWRGGESGNPNGHATDAAESPASPQLAPLLHTLS